MRCRAREDLVSRHGRNHRTLCVHSTRASQMLGHALFDRSRGCKAMPGSQREGVQSSASTQHVHGMPTQTMLLTFAVPPNVPNHGLLQWRAAQSRFTCRVFHRAGCLKYGHLFFCGMQILEMLCRARPGYRHAQLTERGLELGNRHHQPVIKSNIQTSAARAGPGRRQDPDNSCQKKNCLEEGSRALTNPYHCGDGAWPPCSGCKCL